MNLGTACRCSPTKRAPCATAPPSRAGCCRQQWSARGASSPVPIAGRGIAGHPVGGQVTHPFRGPVGPLDHQLGPAHGAQFRPAEQSAIRPGEHQFRPTATLRIRRIRWPSELGCGVLDISESLEGENGLPATLGSHLPFGSSSTTSAAEGLTFETLISRRCNTRHR
jgi:hypothetical protein